MGRFGAKVSLSTEIQMKNLTFILIPNPIESTRTDLPPPFQLPRAYRERIRAAIRAVRTVRQEYRLQYFKASDTWALYRIQCGADPEDCRAPMARFLELLNKAEEAELAAKKALAQVRIENLFTPFSFSFFLFWFFLVVPDRIETKQEME